MRVASLHFYPVKSCAGHALGAADLGRLGLPHDRRYVVLAASGRALTQRDLPQMATIRPHLIAEGIELDLGGLDTTVANSKDFATPCEADVWGRRQAAHAAPAEVNRRLSDFLGAPARLARLEPDGRHSFADSAPLLVTTTATLAKLNAALPRAVGMERFRPNIVIEGAEALAELGWLRLRAGAAEIEHREPCERCEVTTIDQASGARQGEEPLQTLFDRFDGVFGARCGVARPGRLAVGDAVEVVAA